MAPGRPDLQWASKVRASAAFCLVGIMAGTGLYFSNLAYVRAGNEAAAQRHTSSTADRGAPTGLTATAGNAQVTLLWSPPPGGARVNGYKIYLGTSPGGESRSPVGTSLVQGTGYTVTGLANGTTYYFWVTAVNTAGQSHASNEVSATPAATPGAPTGLTATAGNAQVTLSWTPPASDGGAVVNGYEIYLGTSPGGESRSPVGTSLVQGTGYTVTGLANGTTYYFWVTAVNTAGQSHASKEVSATPAATPGAPTGLTATAGNAQVTLLWTPPASDGGAQVLARVAENEQAGRRQPGQDHHRPRS